MADVVLPLEVVAVLLCADGDHFSDWQQPAVVKPDQELAALIAIRSHPPSALAALGDVHHSRFAGGKGA